MKISVEVGLNIGCPYCNYTVKLNDEGIISKHLPFPNTNRPCGASDKKLGDILVGFTQIFKPVSETPLPIRVGGAK